MKFILKLYHVIKVLLCNKNLIKYNNYRKFVCVSGCHYLSNTLPFIYRRQHGFGYTTFQGNLDKGFPPQPCTSFLLPISLYDYCPCRTHNSLLKVLDFLCSYFWCQQYIDKISYFKNCYLELITRHCSDSNHCSDAFCPTN